MLTTGSVLYMQKFIGGSSLLVTGLILIIFVMFTWWRDIIREAAFEHRFVVLAGSSLVLLLFSITAFGVESPIFCSSCDLWTCIACFTRMMKSLCKGNSPKLRGEDFIPQNAEGMWVYIAIFYVVGLSIEYIFYRLEQRAKLASEENADEPNE